MRIVAITAGGISAVLAVLAAVIFFVPVLTVTDIAVTGLRNLPREEVVAATGVQVGDNLVRVSVNDAAAGVAGLPWVKSVTVERHFPSTVQVNLLEREAIAFTVSPAGKLLIDAEGVEFILAEPPAAAVEIRGGAPNSTNWRGAVAVLAVLPANIRAQAAYIDAADAYNFVIRLKDDRAVIWGANQDNANKARAMATALTLPGKVLNLSNPELVATR